VIVFYLLQARETLAEIPSQFMTYMKMHNIKPNPPCRGSQEVLSPGGATACKKLQSN